MQEGTRWLVACDDIGLEAASEGPVVPAAISAAARELGAALVLFHAAPAEADLEQRRHLLETAARSLPDVPTTVAVQAGDAPSTLTEGALAQRCELIVLMERPGANRGFGKTTKKLLTDCPLPLWLVRSSNQGKPRRILAAVDAGTEDPSIQALNDRIVGFALQWASRLESPVLVHSTWGVFGQHLMGGMVREPQPEIEAELADEQRLHKDSIERLLQRHDHAGVEVQVDLTKGDAEAAIPKVIERYGVDLVVMGNNARSGLARWLVGNTAERILEQVSCSVLAVRPS